MRGTFLGVDVGTSGTKALLMDEAGGVIAACTEEYPLYAPRPTWAEQDPEDWWRATCEAIVGVLRKAGLPGDAVTGAGLSGQMHGLVALDGACDVIRPAILWNDSRTAEQCAEITERAGGPGGLLDRTNNRMLPGYTGGKIEWLRRYEPSGYGRIRHILNPKDYVRYRLTGELATDVSDGSGTGLFDVKNRRFSDELIGLLGYERAWFPRCLESGERAGGVTGDASRATGLPEGLSVAAGGGDAVLQTTATGLVRPGVLGVVLGTSGVVAMGLDAFARNDGSLQMFCNIAPGLWHAMGVTLAAGDSYRWCRDALGEAEIAQARAAGVSPYVLLNRLAATAPPGSGRVFYLPYIMGERCPHSDPNARGAFIGLHAGTVRADLMRAVLEGVAFSLRDVGELVMAMDPDHPPDSIVLSGGGASGALWRRIIADVFGLPVKTVMGSAEGGAYGAALLAGIAAGAYGTLAEATSLLREESVTLPGADRELYEEAFGVYRMFYAQLKPVYDAMARYENLGGDA